MILDLITLSLTVTAPICGVAWLLSGKLKQMGIRINGIKSRLGSVAQRLEHIETLVWAEG